MPNQRKPMDAQVVVITGATSSVGTATARMAAKQGAKLVLAAADATALDQLACDIRRTGGEALALRVDASVKGQLTALGRLAVRSFGQVDTWVNHVDAPPDDVFKTAYWSTVNGSIVALGVMKEHGGVIVNFGADTSVRPDIQEFSNALRTEIETDGVPVSITLIRGAASGTTNTPQRVAEAVLYAAGHAKRNMPVSGTRRMLDRLMDLLLFRLGCEPHLST